MFELYLRVLAVVCGVLAGFRGGRLNFVPLDYLVLLVSAIVFAAGLDATWRHLDGSATDVGISLQVAAPLAVGSGLFLILVVDGLRRRYVVFTPRELGPEFAPIRPALVSATGPFESHGPDVFRYAAAASLHESDRLLLVTPPTSDDDLPRQPTRASEQEIGDPFDAFGGMPAPSAVGVRRFWSEVDPWRVIEIQTGTFWFGFTSAPAVRFRQVSGRGRRDVWVAVANEGHAKWLFEWVDQVRGAPPGSD